MGTYKRISAVKISVDIMRFLADQRDPVSGNDIAAGVGIKYGTVMCHLATLEDERFARRINGVDAFVLGQEAALLWSRCKSNLQANKDRIDNDLKEMEIK